MQNEIMNVTDDGNFLFDYSSARRPYCSLVPKTEAEKVAFFNAVNNPAKRVKEMVNMPIELVHIYAEEITFIDKSTGEGTPGVRIVLIDKDGTAYQASSKGIFSSVSKLINIFGEPSTWKKPVKIIPKEISKGADKNVLVFELA